MPKLTQLNHFGVLRRDTVLIAYPNRRLFYSIYEGWVNLDERIKDMVID